MICQRHFIDHTAFTVDFVLALFRLLGRCCSFPLASFAFYSFIISYIFWFSSYLPVVPGGSILITVHLGHCSVPRISNVVMQRITSARTWPRSTLSVDSSIKPTPTGRLQASFSRLGQTILRCPRFRKVGTSVVLLIIGVVSRNVVIRYVTGPSCVMSIWLYNY